MAYTNTELAIQEYIKMFGEPKKDLGYSLYAHYFNYGVVVTRCYQRSSWVDEEPEHSIFFIKGEIKELKDSGKYKGRWKVIGTYTELQ